MSGEGAQETHPLASVLRARGIEIADDAAASLADALLDLVAAGILVAGPPPRAAEGAGAQAPAEAAREPGEGPHAYNMGPQSTKGQVRQ